MHNWAKVYLGDSRAMTEVEDAGIDLAVTTPPRRPGPALTTPRISPILFHLPGLDRNFPVAIVSLSNNH